MKVQCFVPIQQFFLFFSFSYFNQLYTNFIYKSHIEKKSKEARKEKKIVTISTPEIKSLLFI